MKRVFITGGSGGIGAAIVRAFAKEGCQVVFTYNKNLSSTEALAEETGAAALAMDLENTENIRATVEKAAELLGGIDILVNCAGISQIMLFTDLSDNDIARMVQINLTSVMTVTQTVAPYMIRNHSGRIITIGSMWGKTGASCEVHYSATKAALEGFTKALAKELGPSGITVNCIEPGVIATPMNAMLDEETVRELIDATPLMRLGAPSDVADAVLFLASDKASFITGQILGVDGGFAI